MSSSKRGIPDAKAASPKAATPQQEKLQWLKSQFQKVNNDPQDREIDLRNYLDAYPISASELKPLLQVFFDSTLTPYGPHDRYVSRSSMIATTIETRFHRIIWDIPAEDGKDVVENYLSDIGLSARTRHGRLNNQAREWTRKANGLKASLNSDVPDKGLEPSIPDHFLAQLLAAREKVASPIPQARAASVPAFRSSAALVIRGNARVEELHVDPNLNNNGIPQGIACVISENARVENLIVNASTSAMMNQMKSGAVCAGSYFLASPPVAPASSKVANDSKNSYTKSMESYLESLNRHPLNSKAVEALKLSQEEQEKLFKEFYDPISLELMNKPVRMNGNAFDLDMLLAIPVDKEGKRRDPQSEETFYLQNIQPARDIDTRFKKKIEKAKKAKEEKEMKALAAPVNAAKAIDASENLFPNAPGGPRAIVPDAAADLSLPNAPGGPSVKENNRMFSLVKKAEEIPVKQYVQEFNPSNRDDKLTNDFINRVRNNEFKHEELTILFSSTINIEDTEFFLSLCKAIGANRSIKKLTLDFYQTTGHRDPGEVIPFGMREILKTENITAIKLVNFNTSFHMSGMITALRMNTSVKEFKLPNHFANTSINQQVNEIIAARTPAGALAKSAFPEEPTPDPISAAKANEDVNAILRLLRSS